MPEKTKNICGPRIRIARTRKKMRQIDLSVALEDYDIIFNQTVIGKIERGERNVFDYELKALAEVLEVKVDWAALGNGVNPLMIAKIMGHRNTEMIIKVYGKYVETHDNDRTETAMLNDIFC